MKHILKKIKLTPYFKRLLKKSEVLYDVFEEHNFEFKEAYELFLSTDFRKSYTACSRVFLVVDTDGLIFVARVKRE